MVGHNLSLFQGLEGFGVLGFLGLKVLRFSGFSVCGSRYFARIDKEAIVLWYNPKP